jgi:Tol biopolymer transport system component
LYALPLNVQGERKPIEVLRSKSQLQGPRLSPDNRFMTFTSNEAERFEVYAIRFDPAATAPATPVKISDQGGTGMVFWRRDGKELYYLAADRAIMAVEVGSSSTAAFGNPTLLFRPPADIVAAIGPGNASVSRDGERFVIAVPRPQLRQLTMFDRQGKTLSTIGQPGFYNQPNLSPDGTRAVVMRNDPQSGNVDIWTIDLASGKGTPITNDVYPQNAPIWSPDGKQVAYVSTKDGLSGIYRKAADGTGEPELLFQYTPGAGMVLTDWSPDGKFLTFFTGVIVVVPIGDNKKGLERKEIDWLREDYDAGQGRFSPDNRFLAYLSNEADVDRGEVYVRPFDASKPEAPGTGDAVRVSKDGSIGMITWRQDGKELYFMTRNWEVMAVEVTTTPTFKAGEPRLLFSLPGPLPGNPMQWKNVSRDGDRFIFAMPTQTGPAAR